MPNIPPQVMNPVAPPVPGPDPQNERPWGYLAKQGPRRPQPQYADAAIGAVSSPPAMWTTDLTLYNLRSNYAIRRMPVDFELQAPAEPLWIQTTGTWSLEAEGDRFNRFVRTRDMFSPQNNVPLRAATRGYLNPQGYGHLRYPTPDMEAQLWVNRSELDFIGRDTAPTSPISAFATNRKNQIGYPQGATQVGPQPRPTTTKTLAPNVPKGEWGGVR